MKLPIFICLFVLPLNLWANWNAEVSLGIDGETWKIERENFEDGKEKIFTMGNYILKMTFKKTKEPQYLDVNYTVHEKKGTKLTLINKGSESLDEKKNTDIYAKGEPSQPHSIIAIKIKK